jgi:hypothetical protein
MHRMLVYRLSIGRWHQSLLLTWKWMFTRQWTRIRYKQQWITCSIFNWSIFTESTLKIIVVDCTSKNNFTKATVRWGIGHTFLMTFVSCRKNKINDDNRNRKQCVMLPLVCSMITYLVNSNVITCSKCIKKNERKEQRQAMQIAVRLHGVTRHMYVESTRVYW